MATAIVGQNGDALDVQLGRLERVILRNALNRHKDALESAQKKDRELGVPNEATTMHLAVIEGDASWGKGLYDKLSEQGTFDEEAHREHGKAVVQADLTKLATDIKATVEALRGIGLDLDGAHFQGMTYGQRGAIQTWARALAQLYTRVDGQWQAVDPTPEGVEPQDAPLILFDILAPIAALEREAFIGDVVALRDALAASDVHVKLTDLAARTDAERAEARAWLDVFAPALVAYNDAVGAHGLGTPEGEAVEGALAAVERQMPAWLSGVEFEPEDEMPADVAAEEDPEEEEEEEDWSEMGEPAETEG